jgi:hypothetical protein
VKPFFFFENLFSDVSHHFLNYNKYEKFVIISLAALCPLQELSVVLLLFINFIKCYDKERGRVDDEY